MLEPVRKFFYRKGETPVPKSDLWWLRKKVPHRYRAMVGRKEIWRSLDTTDRKQAYTRCVQLSAELEAEWKQRELGLRDAKARAAVQRPVVPEATLSALQREVHERTRDAHLVDPGWHLRWAALSGVPDAEREAEEREFVEQAMGEFLARTGEEFNQADRDRFLPLFAEARRRGYQDLLQVIKTCCGHSRRRMADFPIRLIFPRAEFWRSWLLQISAALRTNSQAPSQLRRRSCDVWTLPEIPFFRTTTNRLWPS